MNKFTEKKEILKEKNLRRALTSEEIEKRKKCDADARASFAIDNLFLNPKTDFIRNKYINGEINADEAIEQIKEFYKSKLYLEV